MKRRILDMVMFVALTVLPVGVKGESTASATSSAKATILEILQLTKVQDLNFGRISNGAVGAVVLTTDGDRTTSGVTPIGESGWTPARFEVRGTEDYEYYIGLPSDITLEKNGNQIVIENLVARPSSSSSNGLVGVVSSDAYFTVGGELVIESATLPPGEYKTSFEVSVGYN